MRLALLLLLLVFVSLFTGYCWQATCRLSLVDAADFRLLPEKFVNWLVKNGAPEIFLPPPLRGPLNLTPTALDINAILSATNQHRALANLPPLVMNETLNLVASQKADDMFAQQYFDHISPTGTGPVELITSSGYDYLLSGENLALGNYRSEAALVQAWMDSPGHRANILKSGFTEIGISAVIGSFEDRATLISVQTFATPSSACDPPDAKLQTRFDQQFGDAATLNQNLSSQRTDLETQQAAVSQLAVEIKRLTAEGNAKIKAGNAKIQEGNRIAAENGSDDEAAAYWQAGEKLQQEGHALYDQAQSRQADYDRERAKLAQLTASFNQQVEQLNQLQTNLQTTTEQLNQQIRQYNTCLEELK